MKEPEILYEDDVMIACVKPDGMPAQSDKSMSRDLVGYMKTYLTEKGEQDPYVAVIHRLDRPVGGVMVLAKTKEAAANLSRQVQDKTVIKYYQAVVNGSLPDFEGTFDDYLIKDAKTNVSRIAKKEEKGAKEAVLHYEVLDQIETDDGVFSYVLIQLETGRHHQIRCQLAHHNVPVYGDTKYNKKANKSKNSAKQPVQIGLIATRLELEHPVTGEHMVFKTEPWGKAFEILDAEQI